MTVTKDESAERIKWGGGGRCVHWQCLSGLILGQIITSVRNIQPVQPTRVSLIMRTQLHCSEISLLIFSAVK
jgi:hypothetical protein